MIVFSVQDCMTRLTRCCLPLFRDSASGRAMSPFFVPVGDESATLICICPCVFFFALYVGATVRPYVKDAQFFHRTNCNIWTDTSHECVLSYSTERSIELGTMLHQLLCTVYRRCRENLELGVNVLRFDDLPFIM